MAKDTFAAVVDYWQFGSARTLLLQWMKARALAETDADRALLRRIEARLEEVTMEEKRRDGTAPDGIVLQVNPDGYAGPLVGGRYQVMKHFIGPGYYVVDHTKPDLLVREGGPASNIRTFSTKEDAERAVDDWTGAMKLVTNSDHAPGASPDGPKGEVEMAKTATKKAAAPKAPAKKAAAEPAPVKTPAAERKASGLRNGEPTVAEVSRDLIMKSGGKKTEAQLVEEIRARFPEKSIASNVAAHYRKALEAKGKNPPPFKAA